MEKSRLFIRNLPKNAVEKDIVKEFKKKGDITDCKVMRNEKGKSRCIAYVGFKNPEDAAEAQKYFNGSMIGQSKIVVDFARPIGDPSLEDTRSRRKKREQMEQKVQKNIENYKKQKEARGQKVEEDDPEFLEFLAAQKSHNTRASWNDGFMFEELANAPRAAGAIPQSSDSDEDEEEDKEEQEETKEEPRITTNRIFIENIPYETTKDDLIEEFIKYGPIEDVTLPISDLSHQSKGFAFVKYQDVESANKAYNSSIIFMGRHLRIKPSEPERVTERPIDNYIEDDAESFKDRKERKVKAFKPGTYNSLLFNPDTVAEVIASRIGVTKAEVLSPESDDAAQRLAMAEAQIASEIKELFESKGISVENLDNPNSARSRTLLIINNLRYATTEEELRSLFGAYGTVIRFVFPESHTVAIVEYAKPGEANRAFTALNYKKLHDTPMYVHYAPEAAVLTQAEGEAEERSASSRRPKVEIRTTTLIVKNLPFNATRADVRNVCSQYGKIKAVRMPMKADGSTHRGFCFLDFDTRQEAQQVFDHIAGIHLLGRPLIVEPAAVGKNVSDAAEKNMAALGEGTGGKRVH